MSNSFYSDQSSQLCLLWISVPPNFQFFIFIKKNTAKHNLIADKFFGSLRRSIASL